MCRHVEGESGGEKLCDMWGLAAPSVFLTLHCMMRIHQFDFLSTCCCHLSGAFYRPGGFSEMVFNNHSNK